MRRAENFPTILMKKMSNDRINAILYALKMNKIDYLENALFIINIMKSDLTELEKNIEKSIVELKGVKKWLKE